MKNVVLEELVASKDKELSIFEHELLKNNQNLEFEELIKYVRDNMIVLLSYMTINNVSSEQVLNYILSNK